MKKVRSHSIRRPLAWCPRAGPQFFAVLAFLFTAAHVRSFAATASLATVAAKNGRVSVSFSTEDPLIARTGKWCREFLVQRGFPATVNDPDQTRRSAGALWSLEVEVCCPTARSLGIEVSALARSRADSSLLSVCQTNGQVVVSIVGRDARALRSGVARLILRLTEGKDRLLALPGSAVCTPFFPIRELVVANRGVVLKDTPYADTLWRRWSDERIRTYAEQLWLCGFNSIQVCEGRSFRVTAESESAALEVARKLHVLADAAHENGLQVSQLVWGQAPFNKKVCWSSPDSRAVMQEEFRWMARTYAPRVDHVVMHMRDPGGCDCGTCDDYQTPQEIAAFVLKEYRKLNPELTVTLSTWFNRTVWAYAPGVRFLDDVSVQYWTGDPEARFRDMAAVRLLPGAPKTRFLDETFCPQEIGIALHKWYDAEKAGLIRDSGRAVDIWGWYLSDQETTTDMSLCMRRVDYYFRSLPRQASDDVRRISTELCFHGWPQIINAYVSGQKMGSPHRDLREIEHEFCAAMFGEDNADRMVQLYAACELVANPQRGDTCLPSLDAVFGNSRYNAQFREALAAGRKVVLDPARPPRLTTATEPQQLLDYLVRHLTLISTLSEAQERINSAKAAGVSPSELAALVGQAEKEAAPFSDELLYPALTQKLKASIHATTN